MAKLDKHPSRADKRARNQAAKARGEKPARGARKAHLDELTKALLGGGVIARTKPIGKPEKKGKR